MGGPQEFVLSTGLRPTGVYIRACLSPDEFQTTDLMATKKELRLSRNERVNPTAIDSTATEVGFGDEPETRIIKKGTISYKLKMEEGNRFMWERRGQKSGGKPRMLSLR